MWLFVRRLGPLIGADGDDAVSVSAFDVSLPTVQRMLPTFARARYIFVDQGNKTFRVACQQLRKDTAGLKDLWGERILVSNPLHDSCRI